MLWGRMRPPKQLRHVEGRWNALKGMGELSCAYLPASYHTGRLRAPNFFRSCAIPHTICSVAASITVSRSDAVLKVSDVVLRA